MTMPPKPEEPTTLIISSVKRFEVLEEAAEEVNLCVS
jgi:hypothetical protein